MEHAFPEHILMERDRSHGNFVLAVLAGLASGACGTVIWLVVSLIVGWEDAGFSALGVGLLVGMCIRSGGRGTHFIFGVLGVIFTLGACLLGSAAAAIVSATTSSLDLYGAFMHIKMGFLVTALINETTPLMAGVYAFAAFEAYMLSYRKAS